MHGLTSFCFQQRHTIALLCLRNRSTPPHEFYKCGTQRRKSNTLGWIQVWDNTGEARLCAVASALSVAQREVDCVHRSDKLSTHSTDMHMQERVTAAHTGGAKITHEYKPGECFYIKQTCQKKHVETLWNIHSWSKTRAHVPTFFFLLHVNEWESMAVPFRSQDLFPHF